MTTDELIDLLASVAHDAGRNDADGVLAAVAAAVGGTVRTAEGDVPVGYVHRTDGDTTVAVIDGDTAHATLARISRIEAAATRLRCSRFCGPLAACPVCNPRSQP